LVPARTDRQRGGVLIGVAGVILVIALSVFAIAALRQTERKLDVGADARARLDRVDAALAQFVARNRRLPCPARGTLASGALGAGTESINLVTGLCTPATQIDGVVPWVTLGLAENDARDAWNGRISYRVQPSLASNLMNLMNMSWCTTAGDTFRPTGPANACLPANCAGTACMDDANYLYAKGLQVQDGGGAWLNQPAPAWPGAPTPPLPVATGAAYVLVSHGANGARAYNASGILQAGAPAPGNQELANRNGVALTGATIFVDQAPVATVGTTYFDDMLSHPSLATVLGKAALGPRDH
jgi:hypothetical protein